MSGLDSRKSDRDARARAQVLPTQDELDKARRAVEVLVPEMARGSESRRRPTPAEAVFAEEQ